MRKHTKIVRKSDRCNKACALAGNLPNYLVSASKNDAQGVLGRAPASKIGVGRAKVERKTFEGRQKIDRQPPEERQSAPKSEKAGRGVPRPRCPSLKSFDRICVCVFDRSINRVNTSTPRHFNVSTNRRVDFSTSRRMDASTSRRIIV